MSRMEALIDLMFDDIARIEGLTRLTRLARERGKDGERWLERVFATRLKQIAESTLEVLEETGDPIGRLLAQAASTADSEARLAVEGALSSGRIPGQ